MSDNSERSLPPLSSNPSNDLPEYTAEKLAENFPNRVDQMLLSGPYTPAYLARAYRDAAKDLEGQRDRLRAALARITHIGPLGVDTYPECYRRMRAIAEEALSGEPASAHETCGERAADTLSGFVPGTRFIRSKLFRQFLEQGFWHAHHVDLIWRYNGQDVREEADWLKDVWYALLEREKRTAEPPRNYSYHGAYAAEVQSDIAEHIAEYKRTAESPEKASDEHVHTDEKCEHGIPRRFCTAVHPSENPSICPYGQSDCETTRGGVCQCAMPAEQASRVK